MLIFKSYEDVANKLLPQHPGYKLIKQLCHDFMVSEPDDDFTYDPEADGYLILINDVDVNQPLHRIWPKTTDKLKDIFWESWSEIDNFYVGVYLANNQYGLVFVMDKFTPDEELEKIIQSHL